MQGEGRPLDLQIEFGLQPVDPTGDEITPGSDIIRKNFQHVFFAHDQSP
jgi:hypothetical protein